MKKVILSILAIVSPFIYSLAQEVNAEYIQAHYDKKEQYITMRDGTRLFTSIYTPKDKSKKYPILLNRTPYTVAPYGEDKFKNYLGNFPKMSTEGYIFVYQDVRGKWMSEGTFENIRPTKTKENKEKIDESSDTYDTIDWLVKNLNNNNGNVGIYGISYPGFYSTASLIDSHPALKAVSPQAPVTDWFIGDDFRHGGALFLMDAFRFMYTFDSPRPSPITNEKGPKGFQLNSNDYYSFFLKNNTIAELKKTYLSHTVKFWNDLEKHQTLDSFWNSRTVTNYIKDVKPAVMIVGGTFDAEDVYGTFESYKQIELRSPKNNNILVVGPWYHGGWVRSNGDYFGDITFGEKTSVTYQEKFELPFFDFYLKGKGVFKPDEATIYFTGTNEWKSFQKWPPQDAKQKTFYLTKENKLISKKPTEALSFTEYISDPNKPVPFQDGIIKERTREYMIADQRFTANRPDVQIFETDPLENDISLAGPITANLKIMMSGTDADFIVKVIDVYPDTTQVLAANNKDIEMKGYQMLIRAEVLRGRFRDGFGQSKAFTPNQITEVDVTLPDVAHTIKKGHKLMIQIQHTWFPLVDRNPNQFIDIFKASAEDYIKNTHRIYFDKDNSSSITLNTL